MPKILPGQVLYPFLLNRGALGNNYMYYDVWFLCPVNEDIPLIRSLGMVPCTYFVSMWIAAELYTTASYIAFTSPYLTIKDCPFGKSAHD